MSITSITEEFIIANPEAALVTLQAQTAEALTVAQKAELQLWQAVAFRRLGNIPQAQVLFAECAPVLQQHKNNILAFRAYREAAMLLQVQMRFSEALPLFLTAQELLPPDDDAVKASLLGNVAQIYLRLGQYDKALDCGYRAYNLFQKLGNERSVHLIMGALANIYHALGDWQQAADFQRQAYQYMESQGEFLNAARALANLGMILQHSSQLAEAETTLSKASILFQQEGDIESSLTSAFNRAVLLRELQQYERSYSLASDILHQAEEHAFHRLRYLVLELLGELALQQAQPKQAVAYLSTALPLAHNAGEVEHEIAILELLATAYFSQKRYKQAYRTQEQLLLLRQEQNDAIRQKTISEIQARFEVERKQAEAEIYRLRNVELAEANARSEKLLHSILPESIAERLLRGEEIIAQNFDAISVLFADLVGFTTLSQTVPATTVITLLNTIFSAFDSVIVQYHCEKIKMIGDGYMAVAGAPIPSAMHYYELAAAALAMIEYFQQQKTPSRIGNIDIPPLQVRIGLHCGPAVGGVIGERRFLYDLFGDTVNTASRMESQGVANAIHCSEDFAATLLGKPIPETHEEDCYIVNTPVGLLKIRERGIIEIKGKGKLRTFFLERGA